MSSSRSALPIQHATLKLGDLPLDAGVFPYQRGLDTPRPPASVGYHANVRATKPELEGDAAQQVARHFRSVNGGIHIISEGNGAARDGVRLEVSKVKDTYIHVKKNVGALSRRERLAEISSKISDLLKSRGMKQAQLATICTVSRVQVSRWIHGLDVPNAAALLRISEMVAGEDRQWWRDQARLGFVSRVTSWFGLALGFYVAILVLPPVIVQLATSSPGVQVFVAVLLLIGGALVGQAIGLLVGFRLHRALPPGPFRQADRVFGAGVGALGVITLLWLLLPSLAAVPGWPAQAAFGSGISRWVANNLPAPPPTLQSLRRMIASGAPEVFSGLGGGRAAGPVPTSSPLGPALTSSVIASTVKVQGQACGLIYEGSGFAVAPSLVVTNAHVVAGEHQGSTSVLLPSGRVASATVVMFDSRRDLALLNVPGLGEKPLPIGTPSVGEVAAAFGHPNGQDAIEITPARVDQAITATGANIYDTGSTTRQVLILAASLAHGDSGGPLVNTSGGVIGVDFAISASDSSTSYALNSSELQAALGEARSPSGASTGGCLSG